MYPKDPEFPPNGVEDMTRLAYLHEPGVLQNLHLRYAMNEIYVGYHICLLDWPLYSILLSAWRCSLFCCYNYCNEALTFADGVCRHTQEIY